MPQFSSGGQFGGSQYNNPQMGFNPQAAGWFNPQNQMDQWQSQWQPEYTQWNSYMDPSQQGMQNWYNPFTGQTQSNVMPGLAIGTAKGYGTLSDNMLKSIDPVTGSTIINPKVLQNMLGGFGFGGNGAGFQGYDITDAPQTNVSAPGAWGGYNWDAQEMIDPSEVIAAQEYKLQEALDADMAKAGARLGQSGMAMSTPYAGAVADSARKAAQDRNAITLQYQYDAAKDAAARQQAQQMADAQMAFGGWQTQGGWDMQSQLANAQNALARWQLQNQLGMQNTQMQNQWNMMNQGAQYDFLGALLGGLL